MFEILLGNRLRVRHTRSADVAQAVKAMAVESSIHLQLLVITQHQWCNITDSIKFMQVYSYKIKLMYNHLVQDKIDCNCLKYVHHASLSMVYQW